MSANLTLNQVGLPAGVTNEAREDGLDTGAVVTATASGYVSTFRMELLWAGQHPAPDTTSQASFAPSGLTGYTFTPTAGCYGTWLVRVISDEGTPDEDEITLGFAIKESLSAYRIPAPQERGDPLASLVNAGPIQKLRSWFNKPEASGPFSGTGGTWAPWWRPFADLIFAFNSLAGGVAQNALTYVTASGTTKTGGLSDAFTVQLCTNAAGIAWTIPTHASIPYEVGTVISLIQKGAAQVDVDDSAIVGAGGSLDSSGNEYRTARLNAEVFIKKVSNNVWHMTGEKVV